MKIKESSIKNKKGLKILVIVASFFMIIYIIWRAIFTLPDIKIYGWVAFAAGIVLLIAEFMSLIETLINFKELKDYEIPEMPDVTAYGEEFYPDVDVFIATHNEDTQLLFKTVNACVHMKYPNKDRVHIFLCDDTKRTEVEELAEAMGVGYFGLSDNKFMKAGNLNNAMSKTNSPLIVTFDADMIPNSNFLMETVPYFALPKMKKDENGNWVKRTDDEIDPNYTIGFIQTPQTFYNPDLFQYNLYSEDRVPNEQDFFFRHVNSGKNAANSPIYAGSNTVISRVALEEVGGIATGTITEDFETGLRIQINGHRCIAIDKPLAKGLAPITVKSLIKQRERWARGCIFSLRRMHLLTNKKISWAQKIAYGGCRIYWGTFTRRFIFMLAPLFYILLGIPVVVCDVKGLLLFWLPANLLQAITLKKVSGNIRNTRWSNVIDTILFPYMIVPIWCEALFIKKKKFDVTVKKKAAESDSEKFLAIPYIVLLILSLVAFAMSINMLISYNSAGTIVVMYWLIINIFSLVMATFFMLGRRNERETERFFASFKVEFTYNDINYVGEATDISEGGFAFIMKSAVHLPHGKNSEKLIFKLSCGEYAAEIPGCVVNVREASNKWKYCVQVNEMDDDNLKEYMQIIYDRVHTLPMELGKTTSYFEDVENNFHRRRSGKQSSRRELPRLVINEKCNTKDGKTVTINNFNFEYINISVPGNERYPDNTILMLDNEVEMICQHQSNGNYKVMNLESLEDDILYQIVINRWNSLYENKKKRRS